MFHDKSKTLAKTGSPIPVAARSKVWVSGSSLAGDVGNPTGVMSVVSVVCCQVEVSAPG